MGPWVAFESHGTGNRDTATRETARDSEVAEYGTDRVSEYGIAASRGLDEPYPVSRTPRPESRLSMRSQTSLHVTDSSVAAAFAAPFARRRTRYSSRVAKIWPVGLQRGTTVTFTLDGRNLSDIKAVIFDSPGITAKVTQITDIAEKAADGTGWRRPRRTRPARQKTIGHHRSHGRQRRRAGPALVPHPDAAGNLKPVDLRRRVLPGSVCQRKVLGQAELQPEPTTLARDTRGHDCGSRPGRQLPI